MTVTGPTGSSRCRAVPDQLEDRVLRSVAVEVAIARHGLLVEVPHQLVDDALIVQPARASNTLCGRVTDIAVGGNEHRAGRERVDDLIFQLFVLLTVVEIQQKLHRFITATPRDRADRGFAQLEVVGAARDLQQLVARLGSGLQVKTFDRRIGAPDVDPVVDRDGVLGQVWPVPKAVVYRSASRLEQLGLITAAGTLHSSVGPARLQLAVTGKGDQAAADWLRQPASHPGDVDPELMVKLALLDRAGSDYGDLVQAQHALLAPVADALEAQLRAATGFDRTVALWRHESVTAALRFLDALLAAVPV